MNIAPKVCLRLATQEILALRAGLVYLGFFLERLDYKRKDAILVNYIEDLWNELHDTVEKNPEAKSHRVHADALGFCVLGYAARAFRRRGKGTLVAKPRPFKANVARLLRRLEKHRKRAKTLWLRKGKPELYRATMEHWHELLSAIHRDRVFPKRPSELLPQRKRIVRMVMANLQQILKEEEEPTPLDADLRAVARKALRHVRRERASVSIGDLQQPTPEGKQFLSIFCVARLRDLQRQRRGALLDEGIDFNDPNVFTALPQHVRDSLGTS